MNYGLSCEQVSALINFYAEGSLSEALKKYVENHIENCPKCKEKFLKIQAIISGYSNSEEHDNDIENRYNNESYENFKSNLSAYIDNELDNKENIKIKKLTISNPLARQDLEDMYTFKKVLHDSYYKTKNDLKNDYSKQIICRIKNDCPTPLDTFYKISALFFGIIGLMIFAIIMFLYF